MQDFSLSWKTSFPSRVKIPPKIRNCETCVDLFIKFAIYAEQGPNKLKNLNLTIKNWEEKTKCIWTYAAFLCDQIKRAKPDFLNENYAKPPEKDHATHKTVLYYIDGTRSMDLLDLKEDGTENIPSNSYILVVFDNFSKLPWTIPSQNIKAQTMKE